MHVGWSLCSVALIFEGLSLNVLKLCSLTDFIFIPVKDGVRVRLAVFQFSPVATNSPG